MKSKENKYEYILLCLILTFCTIPFRELGWWGMDFSLSSLHSALIFSAILGYKKKNILKVILIVVSIISLIFTWKNTVSNNSELTLMFITGILFYVISTYIILDDIITSRLANKNTLFGSISAYILFGITFAFIFSLLELKNPGAFSFPNETVLPHSDLLGSFLYHSFVTLSTLGYGDIQPQSQPARFFCIIEAIIGQMYLVVFVAGIVGGSTISYFKKCN
jgi:voltage-gated potassium channel